MGGLPLKYILDTHTWIWANMRPQNLSGRVKSLLQDSDRFDELLLSAISPWEFCTLYRKGKLGITVDPEEWMRSAFEMAKFRLVPLSATIALRSTTLPPPFHQDPADQIIVATAREENATIVTKDRAIREYAHVRTFW